MPHDLAVQRARTTCPDPAGAADDLARQLGPSPGCVIVYCAHDLDLGALGPLLAGLGDVVVGCTTAGQIGARGYEDGGITAVALSSPDLVVTPYVIAPLAEAQARACEIAQLIRARHAGRPGWSAFGLLLVDGLSRSEERLAVAMYQSLGDVPIVGGSAGDGLQFQRTHVYADGRFQTDAAVFCLFETALPFAPVRIQHVVATSRLAIITGAEPDQRRVLALNGEPAARVYARMVGCARSELSARVFARHPLVVRIGDDVFVRSIARRERDDALVFYCAIEEGLVLRLGASVDPLAAVSRAFAAARARVPQPRVVLGCDGVSRRFELEQRGLASAVGGLYAEHGVVGFSSYGEQVNSAHVNQTFTGVMLGA